MACKYFDDRLAVFHGIFRGLRVRDFHEGTQIKPSIPVMSQTLKTWSEMPKLRCSSVRAKKLAEWALFRDCGYVTIDPSYSNEIMLLIASPSYLAQDYCHQGEMAALRTTD